MQQINIGILGTAEIAPRSLIQVARELPGVTAYGIASRTPEKAARYAQKHAIPRVYSSYEELLACPDIHAVYIPLITSLHAEYTLKAIRQDKHVLVEKPICLRESDVPAIRQALAAHPGVRVLEGLMSQHHPWVEALRTMVQSRVYGSLRAIRTRATYRMDSTTDFRLDPQKGGSVFWEEAILWCHLTQLLVGLQPAAVAGQLLARGPGGADAQFEARMAFPNGVVSECYCSYTDPMEANHWIEFDDAVVKIVNFWRPTFGTLKLNCEIQHKHTQQTTPLRFEPRNYFLEQLKCFVAVIRGERENIDPEESFDRIRVMDAIYRAALREPVESATASAPSHAG